MLVFCFGLKILFISAVKLIFTNCATTIYLYEIPKKLESHVIYVHYLFKY